MKSEKISGIESSSTVLHLRTRKLSDYRDDRTVGAAEAEEQEAEEERPLSSTHLVVTSTRVRIPGFLHPPVGKIKRQGKRFFSNIFFFNFFLFPVLGIE